HTIPASTYQQAHTSKHIPVGTYQQAHTSKHIPASAYQQVHTSKHIPASTYQQAHTSKHQQAPAIASNKQLSDHLVEIHDLGDIISQEFEKVEGFANNEDKS
ncbi:10311_t:CDS:2, partial [Cetraspora pellucida]